ncbi:glucosyl-3-phosphoglycerate synthase [Planosporangium sp. 12N6]|uniref:glucosyl-3-phosphoglycerate synthase n=1 Tax=Planosporangium spinosum TaxID=3402278 RepID=UPI003CED3D1B
MHPTAASWFDRRTSSWRDWPLDRVARHKGDATVSVVLAALDDESTIGEVVGGARILADQTGLVDEVIVVDAGSQDATAKVAAEAGATVYHHTEILPGHDSRPGIGDARWKALLVARGDLLVYVDADLAEFRSYFVTGLLGPLLTEPDVALVKACYDRPEPPSAGSGPVTDLLARPLLNVYFPELAGVVQPLAGEYAARRSLLETLPFATGYGVEAGLLLDTVLESGLDAVAQVDLGQRAHGRHDAATLAGMAAEVLHTVLERVHPNDPRWDTLTRFARVRDTITAADQPVGGTPRPPMATIPEYAARDQS